MTAYYNEIDPFAAEWLENLILVGAIAPGEVDRRSIEDVAPSDLKGFTQCHFFAGIGVWSYALRQAGWPDDRPVWTGSCPCQPFSAAGKGTGFDDERHIWPAFHHLITFNAPPVVFGEQVSSADGLAWLDLVQSDMEATAYAFGALDLCAAGIGAPHIRQRTFWMAHANGPRPLSVSLAGVHCGEASGRARHGESERPGSAGVVAHADSAKPQQPAGQRPRPRETQSRGPFGEFERFSAVSAPRPAGSTNGAWGDVDWLACRDGRWRPVEPGTFPLANGVANRVGALRGYGNAIVAPLAQTFVEVAMEYLDHE